ncbi:MAG: decarboxylating NADP(+)-dependent phosphogluconate dehydrogenase [Spirochaetales bacterium]|nr:decarboxylating NADP(+)-dependent phosphogluconate dehydrogenase [Spirochaetales bacterium]
MASQIAVFGLGVMGRNLILNMADSGVRVMAYDRTAAKTRAFAESEAGRPNLAAAYELQSLVAGLERPRRILFLIKAGAPVDEQIANLAPLLEPGDIIIDGGNSLWADSERRAAALKEKGLIFVGMGVSGGEEGARYGPSLMPGGDPAAWSSLKPILEAIAAKAPDGSPCVDWMGPGGAGHFVKMVHNGIEYGDMQLIGESYHLMRAAFGWSAAEAGEAFAAWNRTELESYLVEITARILPVKASDGAPLVEKIVDAAGQKGTGKWTVQAALESGIPLTLITEAVFSRFLSGLRDDRAAAAKVLPGPKAAQTKPSDAEVEDLRLALLAAKIMSYAQGYLLIRAADAERGWGIRPAATARIWRGGCIIRSVFLDRIREAFEAEPGIRSILLAPWFRKTLERSEGALRRVVARAALAGVPAPAHAAALSFYDGYRSARLPADLLQAQRDFFGSHGYERIDAVPGEVFHTDWTGDGAETRTSTYNA